MGYKATKFATVMWLIPSALAMPLQAANDIDEKINLPSGITASLNEVIWTERAPELAYRFRFVASNMPDSIENYSGFEQDMAYLCEKFALDRLPNSEPKPTVVVISLASEKSDFGTYNPDIFELFESFNVSGGYCEWKLF